MTAAMMTGVTVGVDTHADVHVGVALDHVGRRLGLLEIATNPSGYRKLRPGLSSRARWWPSASRVPVPTAPV
jgi:hypothetical protein